MTRSVPVRVHRDLARAITAIENGYASFGDTLATLPARENGKASFVVGVTVRIDPSPLTFVRFGAPAPPACNACVPRRYPGRLCSAPLTRMPHGTSPLRPGVVMASIDHAMWFHRTLRVDDWLLYDMQSPSASGARGFARAQVFARDGRLVASAAQEGLIRPKKDA